MYLHLGKDTVIKDEDIIGIFDLDTSTVSERTKEFLKKKEKERLTEYADFDLPRSFILCKNKDNGYKVVFSRISTVGLKDRAEEYKTEE